MAFNSRLIITNPVLKGFNKEEMNAELAKISSEYQLKMTQEALWRNAIMAGDSEKMEYVLNLPGVWAEARSEDGPINGGAEPLTFAASKGQLDMVKIIMEKYPVGNYDDVALSSACENGHFEVAQYLLSTPNIDIHYNSDAALRNACLMGHVNIVQYLLTSPDLLMPDAMGKIVGHADIHALDDHAFIWACKNKKSAVINYLLVDYDLQVTPAIQDFFEEYPEEATYAQNILKLRDFHHQLETQLSPATEPAKKVKM